MTHSHRPHTSRTERSPFAWWRTADRLSRLVVVVVLAAAVVTLVGLVALWPGERTTGTNPALAADEPVHAEVIHVTRGPCTGTTEADGLTCIVAQLRVDAGAVTEEPRGDGAATTTPPTIEQNVDGVGGRIEAGDDILVIGTVGFDGTITYNFYDFERSGSLWVLTIVFVAAVLLLGRWRGLGAIAGLVVSLLVLVVFMLPSLLDGNNPVLVAVVAASVIAFVALYLAHGFAITTSVALLGTFASLAITAALSQVFVVTADLTGFTDDSSFFLDALGGNIDLRGIVLAGFVIGALGVLDDVTVTQVSAVVELRAAHARRPPREIYRAAINIGRDHISSTVNTLFLAYAGAALPLLLLFTEAGQSIGSIAGREIVATEIIRSLVGSIGLISAVPITTWLAVRTLPSDVITG